MPPTRIGLVSDLHLGGRLEGLNSYDPADDFDELIEYLTDESDPLDHLLVAGDLSKSLNLKRTTKQAVAQFRQTLQDHGWLDSEAVSVVPGNHDYRGWGFVPRPRTNGEFWNWLPEFHETTDQERAYPWKKVLKHVVIVGLDSAFESARLVEGRLGIEQLLELEELLEETRFGRKSLCLLLHHYPEALIDWDGLTNVVEAKGLDPYKVVFACGHDHNNFCYPPDPEVSDAPGWVISGAGWCDRVSQRKAYAEIPILEFSLDGVDVVWERWLEFE